LIRRDGLILWPVYFDVKVSRNEGRRVPQKLAVNKVSVDDLAKVCKKLELDVEKVDGSHPRFWFRKTGYVIVKPRSKLSKQRLVRIVAEELGKLGE